jgi:hypothetical protein
VTPDAPLPVSPTPQFTSPALTSQPEEKVIGTPSVSPDSEWSATVLEGYFGNHQESAILKVTSADGEVEWIADVVTETTIYGGFERPVPFEWSRTGDYLYFTHDLAMDGCFCENYGSDLYRLDLRSGQVLELMPRGAYWLALSPDEKVLASLSFANGLTLHDLESEEEQRIELDIEREYENDFGGVLVYRRNLKWSPNGDALLLEVTVDACGPLLSSSIIRVDVATLSQTTLIREEAQSLHILEWLDAEWVLIEDGMGNEWKVNVPTGELLPIGE